MSLEVFCISSTLHVWFYLKIAVLCGRGGRINSHPGNIQFRDMVQDRKVAYLAPSTKKLEKAHIAAKIVSDIRTMEPNGRFLKEDRDTGLWFDIGDAKAIKKAGQALREDAPDIRNEIDSGDEKKDPETKKSSKDKPQKSDKPSISPKGKDKKSSDGPKDQKKKVVASGQSHSLTSQQIQAQVMMPPPSSQQMLPPQQHLMPGMTAPVIQASIPLGPQSQPSHNIMPTRGFASGNRSVAGGGASRQAMELLAHTTPGEDSAFGMPFAHPPPPGSLTAGSAAMSDISGLSDPLSSGFGMETGSGFGSRAGGSRISGRALGHLRGLMGGSGRSMQQRFLAEQQQRYAIEQQQQRLAAEQQAQMQAADGPPRMSSFTVRSSSFPDMSAISGESGSAMYMGDAETLDGGTFPNSGMSIASGSSGKLTMGSFLGSLKGRGNSAMSVASMLVGSGSSAQWMAGMMADDGKSILSDMSADLSALDLADKRP